MQARDRTGTHGALRQFLGRGGALPGRLPRRPARRSHLRFQRQRLLVHVRNEAAHLRVINLNYSSLFYLFLCLVFVWFNIIFQIYLFCSSCPSCRRKMSQRKIFHASPWCSAEHINVICLLQVAPIGILSGGSGGSRRGGRGRGGGKERMCSTWIAPRSTWKSSLSVNDVQLFRNEFWCRLAGLQMKCMSLICVGIGRRIGRERKRQRETEK